MSASLANGVEKLMASGREAAQMYGLCEKQIYLMRKAGLLKFKMVGRRVMYPIDGLREWASKNDQAQAN